MELTSTTADLRLSLLLLGVVTLVGVRDVTGDGANTELALWDDIGTGGLVGSVTCTTGTLCTLCESCSGSSSCTCNVVAESGSSGDAGWTSCDLLVSVTLGGVIVTSSSSSSIGGS